MATSTSKRLDVSDLDYDQIRNNLKLFLQNQAEYSDYDFEGSGMSVLLDLLAYNTHYLAYNANMLSNELYLDSADIRKNVVSLARQLGYTPTSVTSPKQVMAAPSTGYVTRIVSHETRTMVVQDGKLWVWGSNSNGELGQNNRTVYSSTIQIGSDTTWNIVHPGYEGSYAIKTDGTLWVWGNGSRGQLGVNSQVSYSSPIQVPGTNWVKPYSDGFIAGALQSS